MNCWSRVTLYDEACMCMMEKHFSIKLGRTVWQSRSHTAAIIVASYLVYQSMVMITFLINLSFPQPQFTTNSFNLPIQLRYQVFLFLQFLNSNR